MTLVIEIPESVKQAFDKATEDDIYGCYYDYNSIIGRAIKNGMPLPKGHGRLIDADKYRKDMQNSREFNFFAILDCQQTIIEADEVESEE